MASMRIAEASLPELARYSMRYIKALKGLTRKCVVLDLDGTLWGGIVGEVGAEGVALGPTAPGIEYVDFQRALLGLTRRGILLAVCSKNNPEDALPVIRDRKSTRLNSSHLVISYAVFCLKKKKTTTAHIFLTLLHKKLLRIHIIRNFGLQILTLKRQST